jgi:outer membrane murein-binding lipoprotein Lpp
MKTSKVFMLCGVALSALLVAGCDSKAHFTQEELDAIKNHKTTPMPAGTAEANAQRMKDGQALYQQRLKEAGMLDANGRRKGDGPGSAPPPPPVPGNH